MVVLRYHYRLSLPERDLMNHNKEKRYPNCQDEKIEQSAHSGQGGSNSGRLQFLHLKNGGYEISVSEGALPEFLIKANAAVRAGQIEETAGILNDHNIEIVRQMVRQDPSRTDVMFILARLFFDTKQFDKAEQWYKEVLSQEAHPFVYDCLAHICMVDIRRLSESVEYSRKAVELAEDNIDFRTTLGRNLVHAGQIQEGIEHLRKAAAMAPEDTMVGGILLWNLHYLPGQDPAELFEEYKRLGRIHAPVHLAKKSHENVPDPERRLRIGYVSADFRVHSTARSFEPFLDGHNRQEVEVYGYGYVARPDRMTEDLKGKFDHYRDIYAVHYEKTAKLIEEDKIDILIEIGGHCKGNCLGILAYKPAPIQVDYGGINTSGMEQIDYRLTDSLFDPPELQKFYVEESVCLPGGLLCYSPPRSSPLVAPLAAKQKGYVTFGSFNNSMKTNPYILSLWAQILKANSTFRLILKFPAADDQKVVDNYYSEFEQLGIDRERIQMYSMFPSHFEHMDLYNQIDIALDTYPYNGLITTLETLWMGVPMVSLVGNDSYLSRVGLSALSRVGLEIFAASTGDEYVDKAIAFAGQLDELAQIRASLRSMMLNSPLCSPKRFTGEVEQAYRKMWHRWCRSQGVDVPDEKLESQTELAT